MMEITANDIKTKGISVLEQFRDSEDDTAITVNGKVKYIVVPIEKYNRIRELELELALQDVHQDIRNGKSYTEIDEHLKRISNV